MSEPADDRARNRAGFRPALPALPALLAAVLASGCGAPPDEDVEFYMPLHRLDLPERPFRRFNAWMAGASRSGEVELTANQSQTAPDPVRPTIDAADGTAVITLEAYPVSWLGVTAKLSTEESPDLLAGKLHLLGPSPGRAQAGDVSLAVTYGFGSAKYENFGSSSDTSLKSRVRDYALVAGWRASRRLLLYGGPFRHAQEYSGTQTVQSWSGGSVRYQHFPFAGEAEVAGYNAGISITPVRWLGIVAEYAHGRIEAGESRGSADSFNAGLQFNFGWRLDPAVR